MKNAQEHNEYTEKENDQLRTDALMMINAHNTGMLLRA